MGAGYRAPSRAAVLGSPSIREYWEGVSFFTSDYSHAGCYLLFFCAIYRICLFIEAVSGEHVMRYPALAQKPFHSALQFPAERFGFKRWVLGMFQFCRSGFEAEFGR
jgi:hypothetical protein